MSNQNKPLTQAEADAAAKAKAEAEALAAAKARAEADAAARNALVKVFKGDTILEVHPTTVKSHEAVGWKVLAK